MLNDTEIIELKEKGYFLKKSLFNKNEINSISEAFDSDKNMAKHANGYTDEEGKAVTHTLWNHPEGLLAILDDGTLVLADSKVVETSGILARYFKHNKVQSFMRQLYNFGFVRSPKGPRRGLPSYYQSSFTHPKVFATCRGPAAPALSPVARRDRFLSA